MHPILIPLSLQAEWNRLTDTHDLALLSPNFHNQRQKARNECDSPNNPNELDWPRNTSLVWTLRLR